MQTMQTYFVTLTDNTGYRESFAIRATNASEAQATARFRMPDPFAVESGSVERMTRRNRRRTLALVGAR